MGESEMGNEGMSAVGQIPGEHGGIYYQDFLENLSISRVTRSYLEIGVRFGEVFSRIKTTVAVGVDPDFQLKENVAANKDKIVLYPTTSDDFFRAVKNGEHIGSPFDFVFLDGMHLFEFLLRDFYNAEKLCSDDAIIIMHDCLPLNAEMAERDMAKSVELGQHTRHPFYWTGDVWKIIPILQKYRPDLRITFVDCPPTGLVCVSNLSQKNDVLKENYFDIVDEFRGVHNDSNSIHEMYSKIKITASQEIISNFNQSIFFKR